MELVTLAFADYDHPDDATANHEQPHHTKRRKINLACEQCRTRKARCDGTKPICSNCSRRKESCVYKVTKLHLDTTQDYIQSLLDKVTALEDENAHLREQRANDERDIVTRMMTSSEQPVGPMETPSSGSNIMSPPRMVVQKKISDVDAMGGTSALSHGRAPRESYFGSSSTTSLMEQVLKAIGDGDVSSPDLRTASSMPVGIDNAVFEADEADAVNFSLFARPVADFLLGRYWEKIHPLYPFVHKPTFMLSYERLWQTDAPPAASNPALGLGESGSAGPLSFAFHCGLNAMLMLGLQFTDLPSAEKDNMIFQCLQKCKNLLKFDLFNEGSLAVLHVLLLLGHYFQLCTTSPNKCWHIVGLACRVAQGLGLHMDSVRQPRTSPIEIELRKRSWYACIILDMIVAMTLGRPVMLRRRHAFSSLPEATDDEYLAHNVPQPETHLSTLVFYRESVKLYRIMREALSSLYKDGPGQGVTTQNFDKTVALDAELARVVDQLPVALRWDQAMPSNVSVNRSIFEQQRHVLHLRWSAARMGLHRPLFIEYCRTTKAEPLQTLDLAQRFAQSAAIVCVEAAITLIEVVDLYAGTEATCEWWYNLAFLRLAAAMLMIGLTRPDLLEKVERHRLQTAWHVCQNVLRSKLPANDLVHSCLEGLESMYSQVEHYVNAGTLQPESTSSLPPGDGMGEIDANAIPNNLFGFGALDGGLFSFGTDEWGFGLDDYGAPLI